MGRSLQKLGRFFRELKRRNVYRVAATYAVVAFVGFQAAKLLIPSTVLPPWTDEFFLFLLIVGFPVAVVVAWAFELTPDGVRRTRAAGSSAGDEAGDGSATRTAYRLLVGVGLVAAAVAGGWYLTGAGESEVADRSIAVLPFESVGGEESRQLARGVHDDLLTRLSNVSDLRVISRTSVERYRETAKSIPQIARELDVKWIVEGGVQQAEDRIRVNAQLIDAPVDDHRWAETYSGDLTAEGLFAIQSELTKEITRSLQAELSPGERERVERRPTGDLEAYRLYVQGRTHLEQRTEGGTRRAAEFFVRAIDRDSTFGPAWAALADVAVLREEYGHEPVTGLLPVSPREAVHRALAIDSTLADAHASLGILRFHDMRNLPAAIRALERAVELKPSSARAHQWLGEALGAAGRLEEAVRQLERSVELDPLAPSHRVPLGGFYFLSGRYRESLEQLRRVRERVPDLGLAYLAEGQALSALGRQEEALEAFERGMELSSPSSKFAEIVRAWPAVAHVRAGDTARARELMAAFDDSSSGSFDRAVVRSALGEPEAALEALRQAPLIDHYVRVFMIRYAPVFAPVRDRSGYRELVREMDRAMGL